MPNNLLPNALTRLRKARGACAKQLAPSPTQVADPEAAPLSPLTCRVPPLRTTQRSPEARRWLSVGPRPFAGLVNTRCNYCTVDLAGESI